MSHGIFIQYTLLFSCDGGECNERGEERCCILRVYLSRVNFKRRCLRVGRLHRLKRNGTFTLMFNASLTCCDAADETRPDGHGEFSSQEQQHHDFN